MQDGSIAVQREGLVHDQVFAAAGTGKKGITNSHNHRRTTTVEAVQVVYNG